MNNLRRMNPLSWPFLIATFVYGVGFAFIFPTTGAVGTSSLHMAMTALGGGPIICIIWGILSILVVLLTLYGIYNGKYKFAKRLTLLGATLWIFAGFGYIYDFNLVVLLSVALPNIWYWIWKFFNPVRPL